MPPTKSITTDASVTVVQDTDDRSVHIGMVPHPPGETLAELEIAWNKFTRLMFQYGVEPTQEAPAFTTTVKDKTFDFYRLRSIVEDDPAW